MTDTPLFQLKRNFQTRYVGPSTHAPWLKFVSTIDVTVDDKYQVHFSFEDPHGTLKLLKCEATDLKTGKKIGLLDPYKTNNKPLPLWRSEADHPTSVRGFSYDNEKGLVATNESMCKGLYERLDATGCLRTISCLTTKDGQTRGLLFNFLDGVLYTVTNEENSFLLSDTVMDGIPVHHLNGGALTRGAKFFNPEREKADDEVTKGFILIRANGNIHS